MEFILRYKLTISIVIHLLWGASFFGNVFNLDEVQTEILIWSCNTILFIFWIFILVDMIRIKIRDKTFWIVSVFLLPFFAPVIYIFRRRNLIHLEDNKFKSSRRFN